MSFLQEILRFLDTQGPVPQLYGWYHIISLLITAAVTVFLCRMGKNHNADQVRKVVFWSGLAVVVLEVYKQINYSFGYEGGITFDYQWYAFPWQFCSTPMYVSVLAGIIKKGKVHDALCAYLATFAIFAGLAVMIYPGDIYIGTVGINFQSTVCHCAMLVIGGYLYASGHVKLESKTILKALPVFAVALGIAVVLNEVAYLVGIVPEETFNMFFVSPHCDPSLPVYSLVQQVVPYPLSLIIYIVGFTAAAYIMLLIAMGVDKLVKKKTRVAT